MMSKTVADHSRWRLSAELATALLTQWLLSRKKYYIDTLFFGLKISTPSSFHIVCKVAAHCLLSANKLNSLKPLQRNLISLLSGDFIMSLTARNPFYLVNEFQRDLNRALNTRLFSTAKNQNSPAANSRNNVDWSPNVDIHENADGYHLSVDLPGVKSEQIDVTADKGVLSIRGSRESLHEDKEQRRSERFYGSFLREFSMPDNADLDRIEAKSNQGVLEIFVPKVAKAEPKRITVQ
jgi:HSP20 family protein